ncbi:hypothetical protein QFC21_005586 [Naganishia friedmannii]|uniref:Uncharacterized protein n=1 Tax=Naganishia friedmannii TaxID=89922 RepID=A0ACC2V9R2_9TREE|nr:hypothetical protein QFC21_005586 [Naganishia friedmannii]
MYTGKKLTAGEEAGFSRIVLGIRAGRESICRERERPRDRARKTGTQGYPQFEDIFQQLVRHEGERWLLAILQHHRDEKIETEDAERRCKLLVTVRQAQFNAERWGRRIATFPSEIGEIDEMEKAKVLSDEAHAPQRKMDNDDGVGPYEGRVSKKRAS